MKKFFSFLVIIALSFGFIFTSCSNDDDTVYVGDGDTIAEVFILNNPAFTATNVYSYFSRVNFTLDFDSDQLLIYRQTDTTTSGNPVWELLPSTYYNVFGSVKYNFDFSKEDFSIYVDGDYDINTNTPENLNNQRFRIVVIPGLFPKSKSTTPPVDYRDYDAVAKYFKIDESKVKTLDAGK